MSLEDAILVLAESVQELTAAIGGKSSEPVTDSAPEPAQRSIRDFIEFTPLWSMPKPPSDDMHFTNYDKNRKGAMQCSRCGKVGYNIRTCDRHQDL
jgi:hypothetical protein